MCLAQGFLDATGLKAFARRSQSSLKAISQQWYDAHTCELCLRLSTKQITTPSASAASFPKLLTVELPSCAVRVAKCLRTEAVVVVTVRWQVVRGGPGRKVGKGTGGRKV